METNTLSDCELLQLMRAGDPNALAALYQRRQRGVYRFALQMSGSASIAEDITQEVFLVLIHDSSNFDSTRGSLNNFLLGVARNHVLRRLQRERFYSPLELNGPEGDEQGLPKSLVNNNGPLDDLSRTETIEAVRKAVLALPERYREVVVLCDLQELSYAETAEVLQCAVGTVRSRLHRARALLISKLGTAPQEEKSLRHYDLNEVFCMNCQSFENIIDDLAREQLIEATRRKEALQHSDECPTCSARLKAAQRLTASLRALAQDWNSTGAPKRVESFLLASFNEQILARNAPRLRRGNYLSVAAAAVILVALGCGFAVWNFRSPHNEQATQNGPTSVVTDQTPVQTVEPALTAKENPEIVAKPIVRRRPATASRARLQTDRGRVGNVAELAATEVTTDFMPIGYVNSASLQDGGSVVRVELPRSTIVSMGFALNMDRSGERVKADVLMGADGLARAIRFVQ